MNRKMFFLCAITVSIIIGNREDTKSCSVRSEMRNKIMQIYATDGTEAELGAMPSGTGVFDQHAQKQQIDVETYEEEVAVDSLP